MNAEIKNLTNKIDDDLRNYNKQREKNYIKNLNFFSVLHKRKILYENQVYGGVDISLL